MADSDELRLRNLVRQRIANKRVEIDRSLRQISLGNPLGSEPRKERLVARLATKTGMADRDVKAVAEQVQRCAARIDDAGATRAGAEALQGPSVDFVGVEFLTRGRLAANTVGRVSFQTGRAQGSGFLVGPNLFLTNHHVISTAQQANELVVEFDYEFDDLGLQRPVTTFAFDPQSCFVYQPTEGLDFVLVAIGPRLSGDKAVEAFGFNPLSDAADKHMLGEIANIIQHPGGRLKQLVLRENNLIARDETAQVLHYLADTERGASGSPVCNNDWEPIALHHWGEPSLEVDSLVGEPLRSDVNEGVRISAIVKNLRAQAGTLSGRHADAVRRVLELWSSLPRSGPVGPNAASQTVRSMPEARESGSTGAGIQQRARDDGTVTWTIPLELSVRLPFPVGGQSAAAQPVVMPPPTPPASAPVDGRSEAAATRPKSAEDFSDRNGYEPGFIQGFVIPLPDTSQVPYRLARNQLALQDEDPHELRYHHFSIVMNAERRLCAFTACNINGRHLVAVNRDDKSTTVNPTPKILGVESLEGAEASDDFRRDPRILDSEQMAMEFYRNQRVPGYEQPKYPGKDASKEERSAYARQMAERTARMLQKGHVILRGDPAWGTPDQAILAEADTFYYTNAAPQLGFFNQGSPDNRPGMKGSLRWRAVETFVLRNALTMRKRVTVFAGPVFADSDPAYRFDSQIPLQFWKVVVWKGRKGLQSLALLASQEKVLEELTKGVPEAMEAYGDEEELARVSEFMSTVEEIERLTDLRFSDEVRDADLRRSQALQPTVDGDAPPMD
ncbi:DNA/RNA non-specific endonuclease [Pseudorhodoferax sp. Leaf265]|uniref:DNA/RNA non-specific endonuclease n=1 Tax=Pseudorhodoferax sp. Leaf265 TaxID=1736315 RepID=UPI0007005078|nr:DNA/RNA non-specific endonuclease [Pseudorhodoferax sp. Leaf265]KQP15565.1 hypothetical protein ASF45_28630 [Pseudorhodoferax sp. Leaf265]